MRPRLVLAAVLLGAALAPASLAIDDAHRAQARQIAGKAAQWLVAQQDAKTGGWNVNPDPKANTFPAITGLALNGLLLTDGYTAQSEPVSRGVQFLLTFRKPDGGIYDKILPSYNTSVCVSALAKAPTEEAQNAVKAALDFLRAIQWSENAGQAPGGGALRKILGEETPEKPTPVGREHPFYGGVGYGRGQRPDMSNLQFVLQAMHDSGVGADDEAYRRALVFMSRVQMINKAPDGTPINDMEYAKGSKQGGFIYATSKDGKSLGGGQTEVEGEREFVEETLDDGTKVSRLRCYGSMTYAGFKSLVYAGLNKNDPRVQAAYGWIKRNYTVTENPGIGPAGLYYYYVAFARAMQAWGEPTITPIPDGATAASAPGAARDWANDLIDQLKTLQNEDGSFKSVNPRWMESDAVLVTAYALVALGEATGK